jgi:hypothetical protein
MTPVAHPTPHEGIRGRPFGTALGERPEQGLTHRQVDRIANAACTDRGTASLRFPSKETG